MLRVFTDVSAEHDLKFAQLAGAVCFATSLAAVSLFNRAQHARDCIRPFLLGFAGISTCCVGWMTNFVAMPAHEPIVPIASVVNL